LIPVDSITSTFTQSMIKSLPSAVNSYLAVKNIFCYGTRRFITVFTKVCPVYTITTHFHTTLLSMYIKASQVTSYPWSFPIKTVYVFLVSSLHDTYSHLMFLDLILCHTFKLAAFWHKTS